MSSMTAYRIAFPIQGICQPQANDCWAAAIAMAKGHHTTVEQVKQLAHAAQVRLNPNGSLVGNSLANARRLAHAAGLQCHDARTRRVTMQICARRLSRGRMVILGGFHYDGRNAMNHAVTMYRLVGDSDHPVRARVAFMDPFNGQPVHANWQHFNEDADGLLADPHFFLS